MVVSAEGSTICTLLVGNLTSAGAVLSEMETVAGAEVVSVPRGGTCIWERPPAGSGRGGAWGGGGGGEGGGERGSRLGTSGV